MPLETANRNPFGSIKVKYFGRELPPRCELRGCYLTDDGAVFYCTNFACNKHKHRRTKHTRYSRHAHLDPARPHGAAAAARPAARAAPAAEVPRAGAWPFLHFACPSCSARDVRIRFLDNVYACGACGFEWR